MTDPVRAGMIRTLFLQVGSQSAAGLVVTTYMAGTAWAFTSRWIIAGWVLSVLAVVFARWAISRAFLRRQPADEELDVWARYYAISMGLTGVIWGISFLLFAHPDQPVTVALTLSCLYSVAAGSTPSSAYHPPAIFAIVVPIFLAVLGKLLATGDFEYILLGTASALYGLTMIAYCKVQSRALEEGFRIRFENVQLVEELRQEKAAADEARHVAEQASLAKSQFLAAASHDLRQPLYALGLFSSSLQELRLDERAADVVRRIQDSIGVMESSFNGLLDLSKLDAGIVKPKLQPVEIDELFDRISQVFRPLALAHGIELRFRSDGEHVMSDPTLIEQVVGNLVANAIRATQTGGILLAARRRGSELRIEVWDTGHGIPAEDLQRIFEDYVQLNNPSRDRKRGLGLGLAIAGRSVALLGSRIEVASRLGRGSCFRFTQPLCEPPSAGLAPSAEPARPGRKTGLPLLLVEDDEDVRAALTNLLSRWGFPFVAVANAEEGLALVSGGARFGLVITDQRLSGEITGLEMIRKVRSMLVDPPPAIIITGEVDSPLLRSAESEGILVLHKPVEASRLKLLLG